MLQELSFHLKNNDEPIANLIEVFYFKDRLWVFTELFEETFDDIMNLRYNLGDNGQVSEEFCKYSLYKACQAVKFLQENDIIHGDIKSDMLMINSDGEIKLRDLGKSSEISRQRYSKSSEGGHNSSSAPE